MPHPTAPANPGLQAYLQARKSPSSKGFVAPWPEAEDLGRILTMALRTPDHGALAPWRLVALLRDDLLALADLGEARARALGGDPVQIEKGRGQFSRSHAAVAVIFSPKPVAKVPQSEQILSAGALCMNILHAANALGWAANWLTGWVSQDGEFARQAFGCEAGESLAGFIHFGTAGPEAPDRPRPDPAAIIRWGLAKPD